MKSLDELVVLIRGGGEVASGVAYKLHRSGLKVCMTEIAHPLTVCRGIAYAEAIFDGVKEIEGVKAELTEADPAAVAAAWRRGNMALVIDPETAIRTSLKPDVLIDALMAKRNTGIKITDAPLVIGLGPGFYAGRDVHLIVETSHEHNLGAVITEGAAALNTGNPISVGGLSRERVVWADRPGLFTTGFEIGDTVTAGQEVARLDGRPLVAPVAGMLRGLLRNGIEVTRGTKLIEVDHVNKPEISFLIADKMKVIADGVLAAIKLKYDTGSQEAADAGDLPGTK